MHCNIWSFVIYSDTKGGMILKKTIAICGCRDFFDKTVFTEFVDKPSLPCVKRDVEERGGGIAERRKEQSPTASRSPLCTKGP